MAPALEVMSVQRVQLDRQGQLAPKGIVVHLVQRAKRALSGLRVMLAQLGRKAMPDLRGQRAIPA